MKKAFTLIELLVVIAIIAILAAILFPVFAQAKEAAKKTQGLSQLKQLGTSTNLYTADYDDTFGLNGVLSVPCYGSDGSYAYSYGALVPFPTDEYASTYTNSANDQCKLNAVQTFMTNAMYPYFKSQALLKDAGTSFDRAARNWALDSDALRATGNAPANKARFSYTYNGLLSGYNASALTSPSTCPVYLHGQGKRNIYGHVYASPSLICDYVAGGCKYVPTKANCGAGNGETSFITTNTNKSGWNVFSGGYIFAYADGHAKFRKNGSSSAGSDINAIVTNPTQDPFVGYHGNGFANGRWYSSATANGTPCHAYMFRPDWDGSTQDPATAALGTSDK
jgi:prepilin-type N-terminal cleavage/methylation domain-containing protein